MTSFNLCNIILLVLTSFQINKKELGVKTKKDFDDDIKKLKVSQKLQRIIADFLEIECSFNYTITPREAIFMRKRVIQEVNIALIRSGDPLWLRLRLSANCYGRRKSNKLHYLLGSLAHIIRISYERQVY